MEYMVPLSAVRNFVEACVPQRDNGEHLTVSLREFCVLVEERQDREKTCKEAKYQLSRRSPQMTDAALCLLSEGIFVHKKPRQLG